MAYRLGIDLGGTSAKVALVNERLRIVREGSVRTADRPSPRELVKKLAHVCREVMRGKKVTRVGVGVAGDIDFERGIVRISPNLKWKSVPLRRLLARQLKKPVVIDNDANVAAWGIYRTQVSKRVKNMMVITLGTGVGGGLVFNGELYHGATGTAGEVGHMIIEEGGRRCNCGNRGCLEAYAGGHYLTKYVRQDLEKGQTSRLRSLYNQDPDEVTPYTIAQAAKKGDPYAKRVWNQVGSALGIGLGNLIYVFNPEMILLTGGVAQAKQLILKPLWASLKTRAFKVPVGAVKIQVAKQAANIGGIGASLL